MAVQPGPSAVFGPGDIAGTRSAMQDAGRRLVTDDQIEDPAVALSAALLADVVSDRVSAAHRHTEQRNFTAHLAA